MRLLFVSLCALALGGCPSTPPAAPGAPAPPAAVAGATGAAAPAPFAATHRVGAATPWYKGGPQQARPPDGTLPAGTKARVLEEGGSYVRIAAETGEEGWVAADALQPLGP